MRPIDADALKKYVAETWYLPELILAFNAVIDYAPTIDVITKMKWRPPMKTADAILVLEKRLSQYCSTDPLWAATRVALAALRDKLPRENPEPLTSEQFQERIGKPVWISGIDRYGIIGKRGVIDFDTGEAKYRMVIGFPYGWEWLDDVLRGRSAYDYPPQEAPHE